MIKMTVKRLLQTVALVAVLTGFAALAADPPLPTAESILDRYIEVTGGKDAYLKLKTEISTGTLEMTAQGIRGTLTRYAADPDKSYTALDLQGVGVIETGTLGGLAWEKSAILGPRVIGGAEKAQALREGAFNAELNWRKLYTKVETAGVETLDGEECYKVILTPAEGKPETTYYQKKSGLAVKTTTVLVSQMGEVPVEAVIGDYREFGGILVASKVTQKAAGQEVTRTIRNIQVNPQIPDDRFEPPAEIKALLVKAAVAGSKDAGSKK